MRKYPLYCVGQANPDDLEKEENMNSKRAWVLIAAAALVAALALVGCGGSAASSSASASSDAASSAASASAAASSEAASSAAADASASASAAAASSASASSGYIGDQAALDIALKDAGLAQGDCTEIEVELDLDDAVVHYDVSFKNGGLEYDYDIDATSGAIIQGKSEVDD